MVLADLAQTAPIDVSVVDLARRLEVATYLEPVIEMTKATFAGSSVTAEAQQDYESPSDWWINLAIDPVGDYSTIRTQADVWRCKLFECCPAYLASAFNIELRWPA